MRYAYRKSDDVPARPNANHNQVRISGMGMIMPSGGSQICPAWGCGVERVGPILTRPVAPQPSPVTIMPAQPVPYLPYPGSTNLVPQLPPGQQPGYTTPVYGPLPLSPAPSPTVAVPASQTAPTLATPGTTLSASGNSPGAWLPNTSYAVGQAVVDAAGHTQQVIVAGTTGPSAPSFNDLGSTTYDGSVVWQDAGVGGAAGTSGIGTWLAQSNLISGVPNWALAGGAIFLVMMMSKRK